MSLALHFENASYDSAVPEEVDVHRWCLQALSTRTKNTSTAEICIRLVTEEESAQLNGTYRGKNKSTNVLSFTADLPADIESPLLGDLAICTAVVNREAVEQGKSAQAHWAHMVIHGCLHLLGYDHIDPAKAEEMERIETGLLAELGFPAPYESAPYQETPCQEAANNNNAILITEHNHDR